MSNTTCPRCSGFENAFKTFAHVNGGLCLLCNGSLVVTEAQARAWLAGEARAQLGRGRSARDFTERQAARFTSTKTIELPTLGTVRICKWADDRGAQFALVSDSDVGELVSVFGVRNGKVWLGGACGGHLAAFGHEPTYACESDAARKMALRNELQSALKA